MPIGSKGFAMIDTRDIAEIAEIAALELLRREQASEALALSGINLVGSGALTGADAAGNRSQVLGRPVSYGGEDTAGFEKNLLNFMPSWMAYDMRLMSERFLTVA